MLFPCVSRDRFCFWSDLPPVFTFQMQILRSFPYCTENWQAVSRTGGHLGSSLGVIELTVALHYVFDTPEDKINWDVSHQVRVWGEASVLDRTASCPA